MHLIFILVHVVYNICFFGLQCPLAHSYKAIQNAPHITTRPIYLGNTPTTLETQCSVSSHNTARIGALNVERNSVPSVDSLGLGAGARLDTSGNRAVDVVLGDPALIVVLARSDSNRGGFRAGERLRNIDDLLGLLVGARALGLGEEGLDPGLVDEVEGTGESSREEEVEEDAVDIVS